MAIPRRADQDRAFKVSRNCAFILVRGPLGSWSDWSEPKKLVQIYGFNSIAWIRSWPVGDGLADGYTDGEHN
jgi:hypothetical protein